MKRTACFLSCLLAACTPNQSRRDPPVTATRGDVFYQPFDAPADTRYSLAPQEDFRRGGVRADTRVVPAYPAQWLARAPEEVWICTEVHIDAKGAVFNTRALHPPPCSAADAPWAPAFRAAVDDAVRQWRFDPSFRCTLPDGAEANGECRGAKLLEAVPVSRAFRFVFRATTRGGVVEGGETPP